MLQIEFNIPFLKSIYNIASVNFISVEEYLAYQVEYLEIPFIKNL